MLAYVLLIAVSVILFVCSLVGCVKARKQPTRAKLTRSFLLTFASHMAGMGALLFAVQGKLGVPAVWGATALLTMAISIMVGHIVWVNTLIVERRPYPLN